MMGVHPQAVWAGSMGALAIGRGLKHGECLASRCDPGRTDRWS